MYNYFIGPLDGCFEGCVGVEGSAVGPVESCFICALEDCVEECGCFECSAEGRPADGSAGGSDDNLGENLRVLFRPARFARKMYNCFIGPLDGRFEGCVGSNARLWAR